MSPGLTNGHSVYLETKHDLKHGHGDASEANGDGEITRAKTELQSQRTFPENDKHSLVLNSFRCLVADIVQQFDGGHPG